MTGQLPTPAGRLPVRGPARLLSRSYLRTQRSSGQPERVLKTKAGDLFQADLGSLQDGPPWVYGALEDRIARLFSYLVQPGDRCVDAGAGAGLYTVRLARLTGATGQVIGIEPDPDRARRAAANVALNGLANAQIIQAAAAGTAAGAVSPGRPADLNPSRGMAIPHPDARLTGAATQVTTITIDEVCAGPVALMKIDAAGHEAAVLAGAAATIERHSPAIVFKHAPELPADPVLGAFGRLAEAGYLLYRIASRRNRVSDRGRLQLVPVYAQPETAGDLLAISERAAARIIPLVAIRDGRT
jgi:FkbM family methyltransferase